MRFLSILRITKHQRYHVEPRYYDEVKEDLAGRTSRIKSELKSERKQGSADSVDHSGIRGAFARRSRRESNNISFLRFAIIVYLLASVVGYLYLGNIVLYLMVLIILVCLFLRWIKFI